MRLPIRVAYAAPNIRLHGVTCWIHDLVSASDPAELQWVGGFIRSMGQASAEACVRLSKFMPLHAAPSGYWSDIRRAAGVKSHATAEDALREATRDADVVIAWEMDDFLQDLDIPVVLVSHSTQWQPRSGTKAHFVAVSEAAAAPFRELGETTVILSGVSIDRCQPRKDRQSLRRSWATGDRKILLSVGRLQQEKHIWTGDGIAQVSDDLQAVAVVEHADFYRLQVAAHDCGDRLIVKPYDWNIGDYYAAADFLLTDSEREGYGNSIVESWVVGLPVICRAGIGIVPEMEAKHGPLTFKFDDMAPVQEIRDQLLSLDDYTRSNIALYAQAVATAELSSTAMASRWSAYLQQLMPQQTAVQPRTIIRRWVGDGRRLRGVLLCRVMPEESWLESFPNVDWTIVATEPVRPTHYRTVTDLRGNGSQRWQDLRIGFREVAKLADFVAVSHVPEADQYLLGVTTPSLPAGTISPAEVRRQMEKAVMRPQRHELGLEKVYKAVILCPHIGFGGTEVWMQQNFLHTPAIEWHVLPVYHTQNSTMANAMASLPNVTVYPTAEVEHPTGIIDRLQPDVVLFWGLSAVGQYLPSTYGGPVICCSHGTIHDDWTREWVRQSAGALTHALAVSYAAVTAYPEHLQEKVTVIYPGIKTMAPVPSRADARRALGFNSQDKVVLFVGRADDKLKRFKVLVDAVKEMGSNLIAVGDMSDLMKEESTAALGDKFHHFGHTSQLQNFYALADVLAMPSESESVGFAILEALQHGVPVVASSRTIVSEFFELRMYHGVYRVDHDATAAVLASTLSAAVARNCCDEPIVMLPEPLQAVFDAATAGKNLYHYIDMILSERAVGVSFRQSLHGLSEGMLDPQFNLMPHVHVDAVLRLEAANTDEATLRSLQRQQNATLSVFCCGSQQQFDELFLRLNRPHWMKRLPEQPSMLHAMHVVTQLMTSEVLLPCISGSVYTSARAQLSASQMLTTGSELVVAEEPYVTTHSDQLAIRKGLFIDLWLRKSPALGSPDQLVKFVQAESRNVQLIPCARRGRTDVSIWDWSSAPVVSPLPPAPVAFVMPFRNQVQYVREAVLSVLAQEGCGFTLYAIDDDSDPAEFQKLYDEFGREPNIQWFRAKRNIGQFAAMNAIMPYVAEEFVLIQDGDDISLPHRAKLTSLSLGYSGAGIFSGAVRAFGGGLRLLGSTYPYDGCWYHMVNPASAFRKSEFVRLGGYGDFGDVDRNKTSVDTDFWLRAWGQSVRAQITGEVIVAYRQHTKSCVQNDTTGFGTNARTYVEKAAMTRAILTPKIRGDMDLHRGLIVPWR